MPELISNILSNRQPVQFIREQAGSIFTIDCAVSENHQREATPTEFEVEDGAVVTDTIIVRPFSLDIQGVITDTPLNALESALTTSVTSVLPPAGIVVGAAALALQKALSNSDTPSKAAFAQLLKLQEDKSTVTVLTALRRYENMFVKNIAIPRDAQTGRSLVFNLSLVQLLLVSPTTVNVQKLQTPDVSASKADEGRQSLSSATREQFIKGQEDIRGFARRFVGG